MAENRSISMPALLPTLYRDLLRLGRQLDAAPLAKALLLAQPERLFDHHSEKLVTLPHLDGTDGEWLARLHAFNRGEYYAPNASAEQAILESRSSGIPEAIDPVDLGLRAMRVMSMAAAASTALVPPQRELSSTLKFPRSPVPARVAEGDVRVGSLLLTHPVSCLQQPILNRAVILVTDVDADAVAGVIINKPLGRTLGESVGSAAHAAIGDSICAAQLHTGGDCQMNMLLLLHEYPDLAGSTPVAEGLFITNGIAAVRSAFDSEPSGRGGGDVVSTNGGSRVKAVAGYAGWARQQLEEELQRNVWFHVEVDDFDLADLALRKEVAALVGDDVEAEGAATAMWSETMRALGGEHVHLAEFPAKEDVVWEEVQALWQQQREELQRRIDLHAGLPDQ